MKKRLGIWCLILSVVMLAGCVASASAMDEPQPAEEQAPVVVEQMPIVVERMPATGETEVKEISSLEAKATALKDANLTEADVTALEVTFDRDDNAYEVDFRNGDYEYDYTIHGKTGKIIEKSKERDVESVKKTAPKVTEPVPTKAAETSVITKEKAKSIALKHAGLSVGDVKEMKCEYDVDDGAKEYEVEFKSGKHEYSYDIHAETGKIRSWDKEIDD